MKKIFLFFSIIVGLGFALNSCLSVIVPEEDDQVVIVGLEVPTLKTFYLWFNTARLDKVTTYAYPYVGNEDAPAILWGSEEYTGAFMRGYNNTTLYANKQFFLNKNANANGTYSAVLVDTITTAQKKAVWYGYYPYQSSLSGTTATFRLDSAQNQSIANSTPSVMDRAVSENLFLISTPTDSFEIHNSNPILAFQSVLSILRFQFTKSASYSTFISQNVKNVKLYIAAKNDLTVPLIYNLAGDYSIDVMKAPGTSGYQGPVFASEKGKNVITATVSGEKMITETLAGCPNVWFIVNPVTIKSNECLVAVIGTDSYRIIDTFGITSLRPHNIYSFHVQATPLNTPTDSVVITFAPKNQASNCYIVSRPGVCMIPLYTKSGVSVQGNRVEWLWASKENGGYNFDIKELIDPATIKMVQQSGENFVRFRVGTDFGKYTKGNVILASKDAAGTILWTWHIWITDQPDSILYQNGKRFLDRNIGALTASSANPIDNFGFVYQWGRKDPFVGGDGRANENSEGPLLFASSNTIRNTGATWQKTATTQSADYAKRNPMTFICNPSTSNDLIVPVDWISVNTPNRWMENEKTDNDPCPYGYRVPSKAELGNLHFAAETGTSLFNFKYVSHWHWNYLYYEGSIQTAWPAAGMRRGRSSYKDPQNITSVGAQLLYAGTSEAIGQCFYWTSSPITLNNNSILPFGSHRIHTAGNLLYSDSEFGDNADAYPIRCIKMP